MSNRDLELLSWFDDNGIDLSAEDLRWEYEAGLLVLLLRVIPAEYQDMLDLGEERGHEIAITWINRIFKKLRNVDFKKILGQGRSD